MVCPPWAAPWRDSAQPPGRRGRMMTIKVGDKIPAVKLKQMTAEGMNDVDHGEFFKAKRVVLFALPGAFTPTCSAKHLPGFVDKAAELRSKGVDTIACLA